MPVLNSCQLLVNFWDYIDAFSIHSLYQPSHQKADGRTDRVRDQNSEERESTHYILPAKNFRNLILGFFMQELDFVLRWHCILKLQFSVIKIITPQISEKNILISQINFRTWRVTFSIKHNTELLWLGFRWSRDSSYYQACQETYKDILKCATFIGQNFRSLFNVTLTSFLP